MHRSLVTHEIVGGAESSLAFRAVDIRTLVGLQMALHVFPVPYEQVMTQKSCRNSLKFTLTLHGCGTFRAGKLATWTAGGHSCGENVLSWVESAITHSLSDVQVECRVISVYRRARNAVRRATTTVS